MKKALKTIVFIIFALGIGYLGYGVFEYHNWLETKQAIASGGFPNLYAGRFGAIIPSCVISSGSCTCPLCNDCGCVTYNQATIAEGQTVNKGAINLCVSDTVQVKGTPVITASGKQFIAGSLAGKCLTGNSVLATPGMAANNIEKIISGFDFIIAGMAKVIK
jgi:hypothetical protein